MEFNFAYGLTKEEKSEIESFYDSLEYVSLEQYPSWAVLEKGNFKNCFFTAKEAGKIVCSAVIIERKAWIFRFAIIQFGPLFREPEVLVASIGEIEKFYRKKSYVFLTIQLGFPTGSMSDLVEYRLNKLMKINTFFDRENWSSLVVDLYETEENIRRNFSKGHKSDLKKSEKNDITVSTVTEDWELEAFCRLFVKMNRERGLPVEEIDSNAFFQRTFSFLHQTGKGEFMIVKDEKGTILGGIVLIFQGNTVRYFKATSDSAFRHIPVLHLALWEGIKRAKARGFHFFDFWGYNHFVDEGDQVFFINRFKKGFGGNYLFYPKKMYFSFKPAMYRLYQMLKGFQELRKRR